MDVAHPVNDQQSGSPRNHAERCVTDWESGRLAGERSDKNAEPQYSLTGLAPPGPQPHRLANSTATVEPTLPWRAYLQHLNDLDQSGI
jgi:hypothetical protein